MYYRTLNNKIIDCANFKYNENAVYTDKVIIRKYTGELIFKEEFLKNASNEELNNQKKFEEEESSYYSQFVN